MIIIIIIAWCASRCIRPSHCPPNPPCCLLPPWPHLSSPTLPCLSLSRKSPSPSGLWSLSHLSTFCCPPQCRKQLFTSSLLSMCPDQFHLLLCTSQLISFISTILLFFILCCHLILSIHLKHWHWKLFSFLSLAFVIFLVSQPHIRTGRTKVLNRHTLVLLLIPLTAHTCLILC